MRAWCIHYYRQRPSGFYGPMAIRAVYNFKQVYIYTEYPVVGFRPYIPVIGRHRCVNTVAACAYMYGGGPSRMRPNNVLLLYSRCYTRARSRNPPLDVHPVDLSGFYRNGNYIVCASLYTYIIWRYPICLCNVCTSLTYYYNYVD